MPVNCAFVIDEFLTRRIFPSLSRRIKAGGCFRISEIQRSILILKQPAWIAISGAKRLAAK